jgi:hypothetical protein
MAVISDTWVGCKGRTGHPEMRRGPQPAWVRTAGEVLESQRARRISPPPGGRPWPPGPVAGSRSGPSPEPKEHLVVGVRPGTQPGAADIPDDVSPVHPSSRLHAHGGEMRVPGQVAPSAVLHVHRQPVGRVVHPSRRRSRRGATDEGRVVQPGTPGDGSGGDGVPEVHVPVPVAPSPLMETWGVRVNRPAKV